MSLAYRSNDLYKKFAYVAGRQAGRYVKSILQERAMDRQIKKVKKEGKPFSSNKMPKNVNVSTTNALAGRAAVRRKGKKVSVKSRKSIKVSKGFREKFNKVMAGKDAYGEYYTRMGAAIGYVDPGTATAFNTVVNGVGRDTNYIVSTWANPSIAGAKVWFSGLCNNGGTNIQSDSVGGAFVYFSPLKILNAASVLWNQKVSDINWTTVTGNFSTVTNIATGVPEVGSSTFPATGSMDVRVVNSYAVWHIKNINQRTVKMKIYHCVSKLKFGDVAPLTTINNPGFSVVDTATNRSQMTAFPLGGASIESGIITHPLFEPNKHPNFNQSWKYDMTEVILKPGEEFVHTIQGPKNYTLDYSKLHPDGTSEVGSFFKDTTTCCMVSVELDSAWVTDATFNDAGQWYARSAAAAARLINPISIEVDEVYKLSCPKNTGFISRAAAAGTVQSLNLVADRYLFSNFNSVPSNAQTYTTFNEENPAAAIAESTTN